MDDDYQRFRAVFHSVAFPTVVTDAAGTLKLVNPAYAQFLGRDPRTLCDTPLHPPEDDGRGAALFGRLRQGSIDQYQTEQRFAHADGHDLWGHLSVSGIRDASGVLKQTVVQVQDVTARRQAETLVAEQHRQLERSNAELEQFAYIASHDLQEPLRKIQTLGDFLAEEAGATLDETCRDYLTRMQDAAGRMRRLIQDLLRLSRVSTHDLEPREVDLSEVLADVRADLELALRETDAELSAGELPTIQGDPTQLRQLLQNLVANGLKFQPAGNRPQIRVLAERVDQDRSPDGTAGAALRLSVRDNGIGFDERHLDRIFVPFKRLHGRQEYPGSGIGLAVCRKIVERHGGTLTARSTPGAGSVFVAEFPASHPVAPEPVRA